MKTYITNLNGLASTSQEVQNMITDIACDDLDCRELCIYSYNWPNEPDEVLNNRIDGIVAALRKNDTVIFQFPAMNLNWDNRFVSHVRAYNAHLIILIHDLPSQHGNHHDNFLLKQEIKFLNQADLIITPSQQMIDLLNQNGLSVKKTINMKMWDRPGVVNPNRKPHFKHVLSYVGNNPNQEIFRNWNSDIYRVQIFATSPNWDESGVYFSEPHQRQELIDNLRLTGGLGFVWDDDNSRYSLNPSYAISYYLAAGLPIIVPANISVSDIVKRNHLGMVVNSLDEAGRRLADMTEEQYNSYATSVDFYSNSLRMGLNTKLALTEAMYQLFST